MFTYRTCYESQATYAGVSCLYTMVIMKHTTAANPNILICFVFFSQSMPKMNEQLFEARYPNLLYLCSWELLCESQSPSSKLDPPLPNEPSRPFNSVTVPSQTNPIDKGGECRKAWRGSGSMQGIPGSTEHGYGLGSILEKKNEGVPGVVGGVVMCLLHVDPQEVTAGVSEGKDSVLLVEGVYVSIVGDDGGVISMIRGELFVLVVIELVNGYEQGFCAKLDVDFGID
mmetsp:Transcript_54005/g.80197  ORF Transcript_54005/g.80197 Transcript_54005/m.80197 type:complete len:228 (+) Transcript_54005:132-815(+)